ncbi:MAG: sulfite exporter TauE/SafE family protein [Planctomycetes bacterium]|nr:sulfite exporter TauE/SafE family protein [Planctomycetota bacterium]
MPFEGTSSLLLAATLGIGSALHCIGMCGGFSLMIAARGRGGWRRLLLFHGGRIASYTFLGALAGGVGRSAARSPEAQRVLALLAGGVLLLLALHQLGVVRRLLPARVGEPLRRAAHRFSGLLRSLAAGEGANALLLFGAANGFLPCGATAAALGLAAASGSGALGAATLATFGAATVPALFAFGLLGGRLALPWRTRIGWIGAVTTLLVGGITLWRGLESTRSCCSHG